MTKKAQPDGRSKKRPGIEEQTETIINAAIPLFIERGTQNTSVAQLCTAADVSKPTFYRCFKDKDELVSYLYQQSINDHVETLVANSKNSSNLTKQALNAALDQLLDAIFAKADLAQLLYREHSDPNSPAAQIIDKTFDRLAKQLEKSIRPSAKTPPSRTFLKAMMAAFQWVVYDAIKGGVTPKKVKEAKQAAHELAAAMFL